MSVRPNTGAVALRVVVLELISAGNGSKSTSCVRRELRRDGWRGQLRDVRR